MRYVLIVVLLACAGAASALARPAAPVAVKPAPTACRPNEKLFRCHLLALDVHLGVDRPADPAAAKRLYADACNKGHAPSCNNLGVIAIRHPELADGVDPAAHFANACRKLQQPACDNERRVPRQRELAVRLILADALVLGEARARQLETLACAAGDVFRCTDTASRERVAALFAAECRGGERTLCFDAAAATTDAAAAAELLALGCSARDGKACHALATRKQADGAKPAAIAKLWKAACTDDGFDTSPEATSARSHACEQWAGAAKSRRDRLAIAAIAERRCTSGEDASCSLAKTIYDRAGAAARAFAIVKRQCEQNRASSACEELADRHALGLGTPRSVAKRIELVGPECAPPTAWPVCKAVSEYHLRRPDERLRALATYEAFCKADHAEACYLGARAAETGTLSCVGEWLSAAGIHATYERLCKQNFRDACRRQKAMCALAMRDLVKPRSSCGGGVGDGSFQPTLEHEAVLALCPRPSWTKEVQQLMAGARP